MNIPDRALEAAVEAITNRGNWHDPADAVFDAQAALEAAAPYLYAQALRDAARELWFTDPYDLPRDGKAYSIKWLKTRADELDPHE